MSNDDANLTRLLDRMAPPARDPLFRVRVMERKQRQWLRRRVTSLLGILVVVAVTAVIGITASGVTYETARLIVLGVGAGAGITIYALSMRQIIRRFRV